MKIMLVKLLVFTTMCQSLAIQKNVYFEKQGEQRPLGIPCKKINNSTYVTIPANETIRIVGTTKDGLTIFVWEQENPFKNPIIGILAYVKDQPMAISYMPNYDFDGYVERVQVLTVRNHSQTFGHLFAIPGTLLAIFGGYKVLRKLSKWYKKQNQATEISDDINDFS